MFAKYFADSLACSKCSIILREKKERKTETERECVCVDICSYVSIEKSNSEETLQIINRVSPGEWNLGENDMHFPF